MELSNILEGRCYAVTGAGSGIGFATTSWLLDRGAVVAMLDVDQHALKDAESMLQAAEGRIASFAIDICHEAAVSEVLAAARSKWGIPLSGLVNSAGIARNVPFMDTSADMMRKVFDVNVVGTFLVAKAFVEVSDVQGSSIVNVASISGMIGNSGRAAYGASKGAVIALTKIMATELAEKKIRVNAVSPGPVQTPMIEGIHVDATKDIWVDRLPLKRFALPVEIAEVIGFVVSPSASYITGQVLVADGGYLGAGVNDLKVRLSS